MKKILLLSTALIAITSSFAQKQIDYFNPPAVESEDLSITLTDVFSDKELSKLKLIVTNKSMDSYLVYNTDKTGFNFEGLGTFYPERSKEMVIAPGDKKSRVVKIKDNDYRIPQFIVQAEGLMGGAIPDEGMGLQSFPIVAGSPHLVELGGIKIEMEAPESKKGSINAELLISFNGTRNQLVVIDPSKIRIENGSGQAIPAEIGKGKVIELRPSDKKKVKVTFTKNANTMNIVWHDAIKLINMEAIEITPVNISSVDKNVKASTVGKVSKVKTKQPKSDKESIKAPPVAATDWYKCKEELTLWSTVKNDMIFRRNITVEEITKTHIIIRDCVDPTFTIKFPKSQVLCIEYANGSYDHFDYNGGKKQGLKIVRSKKEIAKERHTKGIKEGQSKSYHVIGHP